MAKSSKDWLRRHVSDQYVKKAREQGYRSRAAFKLLELDEKEKLLRPGHDRGRPRRGARRLVAGRGEEGDARRRRHRD